MSSCVYSSNQLTSAININPNYKTLDLDNPKNYKWITSRLHRADNHLSPSTKDRIEHYISEATTNNEAYSYDQQISHHWRIGSEPKKILKDGIKYLYFTLFSQMELNSNYLYYDLIIEDEDESQISSFCHVEQFTGKHLTNCSILVPEEKLKELVGTSQFIFLKSLSVFEAEGDTQTRPPSLYTQRYRLADLLALIQHHPEETRSLISSKVEHPVDSNGDNQIYACTKRVSNQPFCDYKEVIKLVGSKNIIKIPFKGKFTLKGKVTKIFSGDLDNDSFNPTTNLYIFSNDIDHFIPLLSSDGNGNGARLADFISWSYNKELDQTEVFWDLSQENAVFQSKILPQVNDSLRWLISIHLELDYISDTGLDKVDYTIVFDSFYNQEDDTIKYSEPETPLSVKYSVVE